MNNPFTLRVLGTSVTLLESVRMRAEADLGINIEYLICDVADAQRLAVTSPECYDLYDQWFHNIDFVWPAYAIQPIEVNRINCWDDINALPKTSRLTSKQPIAVGGSPSQRLYVQADRTLGESPSDLISMLPLTHNADSFMYRPEYLPPHLHGQAESWAWLLDPGWEDHIALQSDAAIGVLDAALAVQSSQLVDFANMGDMSLIEIDKLTEILVNLQKGRHLYAFWKNEQEAIKLLLSGQTYIQSMWSPACIELYHTGINYKEAVPKEGYRAWFGGISMSYLINGKVKDAAYEYLNWWLSGWPGAMMARQGLYMPNPESVKNHLSLDEWNYWYGGQIAKTDLLTVDGTPLKVQGTSRSGGSYFDRMSNIGIWNSVMQEHNYLVRRWRDIMVKGRIRNF